MGDTLADRDIVLLRANNPGPFTLSGTNTWIVGRDPCWIVDPGPALDDHIEALVREAEARGGAGGIALTHDHEDHVEAVPAIAEATGAPVSAMRYEHASERIGEGDTVGPLTALHAPGHAPDHLVFLYETACFTGDAVLGEGSVFIAPDPGALAGYLEALQRLQGLELDVLCPGHGPPVDDPAAKIAHYIAHRLDRERRLIAALDAGMRSTDELLDNVWDDAPPMLRPAAAVTLAAHLDKLEEEDRLPPGVSRPR